MQYIPLNPLPSQVLTATLGGQICQLNIYQKAQGMFVDVYVNGVAIIIGVIAHNVCRIVRYAYLGFLGDMTFLDTQGTQDPVFTGLGSRFVLLYLSQEELNGVV